MFFVIPLGAKYLYKASGDRTAELRQRQSEGSDALWA